MKREDLPSLPKVLLLYTNGLFMAYKESKEDSQYIEFQGPFRAIVNKLKKYPEKELKNIKCYISIWKGEDNKIDAICFPIEHLLCSCWEEWLSYDPEDKVLKVSDYIKEKLESCSDKFKPEEQ